MPEINKDDTIFKINHHKKLKVSLPKEISFSQTSRWICFNFCPLPKEYEFDFKDHTLFNTSTMNDDIKQSSKMSSIYHSLIEYLRSGKLISKGTLNDSKELSKIPCAFWTPRFSTITSAKEMISTGGLTDWFISDTPDTAFDNFNKKHRNKTYTNICIKTKDIAKLFKLESDLKEHDFGLKKNTTNPKGAGRPEGYDWIGKISPIAVFHIMENGLNDNKEQDALAIMEIYKEIYGEDNVPAIDTIKKKILIPLHTEKNKIYEAIDKLNG